METTKLLSANSQRFSARIFNLCSMVAVSVPVLVMIWIAASIFVYASVAHHPNEKVVHYNRIAGYRFYGATGALVIFGQPIYGLFSVWWQGLLAVWLVAAVVVLPLGVRDLFRVQRENWQDMEINGTNNHE
jgi:hypothetical protein